MTGFEPTSRMHTIELDGDGDEVEEGAALQKVEIDHETLQGWLEGLDQEELQRERDLKTTKYLCPLSDGCKDTKLRNLTYLWKHLQKRHAPDQNQAQEVKFDLAVLEGHASEELIEALDEKRRKDNREAPNKKMREPAQKKEPFVLLLDGKPVKAKDEVEVRAPDDEGVLEWWKAKVMAVPQSEERLQKMVPQKEAGSIKVHFKNSSQSDDAWVAWGEYRWPGRRRRRMRWMR